MVLVRLWIWRTRPSVSLRNFHQRSDHRAWSSRSLQPWQGWARSARLRSVIFFSWSGRRAPRPKSSCLLLRRLCGASSLMAWRMEEARSRRALGTLALNDLGMRIRVTGETGPSRSWTPIRRSWLSEVSTDGRGSRALRIHLEHHCMAGQPAAEDTDDIAGDQPGQGIGNVGLAGTLMVAGREILCVA